MNKTINEQNDPNDLIEDEVEKNSFMEEFKNHFGYKSEIQE
jgi:hypothetical protein